MRKILLKSRKHSYQGFTILETLVSIIILTVFLSGGIAIYTNATAIMTVATHKKIAMEMANQFLEQLKKAGYSNALLTDTAGGWTPASPGTIITFGDFSANLQRRITNTGSPSNKTVEVRVTWTEAGKQTSELTLATYIAQ
jgi:type II secretory pathway pseudopilin PulG